MKPDDDRAARAAALDVRRSFIVQAPAGSGKTELLVQRYLALLATVEQPEEVLAITFTRKAAQEMQLRVMDALQRAAAGAEPGGEHQRVTLEAASRVLARDREREWGLPESPRRLRIQTLDALNAWIASSLPLSSGLGGAVRVLADEEIAAWYGAGAAATLDWLAADAGAPERPAVERVLLHLDNDTDAYIARLTDMLGRRDQWLPIVGTGTSLTEAGDGVRRALERNVEAGVNARLAALASRLPADAAVPAASVEYLPAWRELADLLLTRAGRARRSLARGHGLSPREAARMQALLEVLDGDESLCALLDEVRRLPDPHYDDGQWEVLQALFRLLPIAAAELRRLFRAHGVTDYIEVANAADRALGSVEDPGDVALLLDYGIRHLLVDEMQDTSLAQYRLLEKLVAGWQPGDGRTLFCVGDPMQSIYRFRDAEVGQFLLARSRGIGGVELEPLVLRRNFRSAPALVHWFNEVFPRVFPATDDAASGAISYTASVAAGEERGGTCRVHAVIGGDPALEAARGLAVIERCLAEHPREQSIAVLVRSRAQLAPVLEKLREAGIAYQAIEIDRLTDVPEIIELRALARALCHRGDRIAWLALLRAPWVGLSWADLHALVRNDRHRTVWELLHDELRVAALSPEGRAHAERFVATLEPLLDPHGLLCLRDRVERAWYALGGPRLVNPAAVDNVYRFLDVLERNEAAGTLEDPAELEHLLDRERVQSGTSADARVQVMTIHRAKGLEFDHVILYALGRRARGDRRAVLSWLTLPGSDGSGLLVSAIGARGEGDRLHAWIEAAGQEKDRLEQDRLLYVACTRARQSLHLVGHAEPSADGKRLRTPSSGTLLGSLWPAVREDFEAAFAQRGSDTAAGRPRQVLRRPQRRQLPEAALRLPPPAEPPGATARTVPDPQAAQPVSYDWVGTLTRQAGTLVHRWLKRIADEGADPPAMPPGLGAVTRRWAAELGVPAADLEPVCQRVRQALEQALEDARGRWLLSGEGHAELPLTGWWEGRLETVVLDRVRVDDDGVHWIVDYKTSVHEGGALARFLADEVERYRPQLEKYAHLYASLTGAPVRAALYFPLLSELVPVPLAGPASSRARE
ncbi:MAG TPA: UvrD-helicase domain-containing protein [Woeseiaceae bacterium]|nr:UvrD-helicase domain-containing protein [Woeseiaceae bacterium]